MIHESISRGEAAPRSDSARAAGGQAQHCGWSCPDAAGQVSGTCTRWVPTHQLLIQQVAQQIGKKETEGRRRTELEQGAGQTRAVTAQSRALTLLLSRVVIPDVLRVAVDTTPMQM